MMYWTKMKNIFETVWERQTWNSYVIIEELLLCLIMIKRFCWIPCLLKMNKIIHTTVYYFLCFLWSTSAKKRDRTTIWNQKGKVLVIVEIRWWVYGSTLYTSLFLCVWFIHKRLKRHKPPTPGFLTWKMNYKVTCIWKLFGFQNFCCFPGEFFYVYCEDIIVYLIVTYF